MAPFRDLSETYDRTCRRIFELKCRLNDDQDRHPDTLDWPLFLDRLLLRLETWGDEIDYEKGTLEQVSQASKTALMELLASLKSQIQTCSQLLFPEHNQTLKPAPLYEGDPRILSKQPSNVTNNLSDPLQRALQDTVHELVSLTEPPNSRLGKKSYLESTTQHWEDIFNTAQSAATGAGATMLHTLEEKLGGNDEQSLDDEEEIRALLEAPSSITSSRRSSYCEAPHPTLGSSIEHVFKDSQSATELHRKTLASHSVTAADTTLEELITELCLKVGRASGELGRTHEFSTTISRLDDRLRYLDEAVTSLLIVGSRATCPAMELLWRVYAGAVAMIPKDDSSLLQQVWDVVKALTTCLPRSNYYSIACVRAGSSIQEEDLAILYSMSLKLGFDLSYFVADYLERSTSSETKIFEPMLANMRLPFSRLRKASTVVDIHALQEYMRRHANSPSALRKFMKIESYKRDRREPSTLAVEGPDDVDTLDSADELEITPSVGRCFDAPYSLLTIHFRGREAELFDLASSLDGRGKGSTSFQLITGAEGIGKTQLALNFTTYIWEIFPYRHVFWLCAASADQLRRGLEAFLKITHADVVSVQDPETRVLTVRDKLQELSDSGDNWTMIVDDVRPDDDVSKMLWRALPIDARGGQIIFTSRVEYLRHFDTWRQRDLKILELGIVSRDCAMDILFSAAGSRFQRPSQDECNQALEIVDHLACFPMAVKQCGAHFKRYPDVHLEQVLPVLKKRRRVESQTGQSPQDFTNAMAAVLHMTLDEVFMSSHEAYQTLELLAFLDPENIPLEPLLERSTTTRLHRAHLDVSDPQGGRSRSGSRGRTYSVHSYMSSNVDHSRYASPHHHRERIIAVLSTAGGQNRVISRLLETSLVGVRSVSPLPRLRMHDRVQHLLLNRMDDESKHDSFEQAVTLVDNALRPLIGHLDKSRTWQQCDLLAPHLQALVSKSELYKIRDPRLPVLYSDFGWYFYARGRYTEAARCYEETIPILNNPERGIARENLARVFLRQGEFAKAIQQLELLFSIRRHSVPILNNSNLRAADLLAKCYYSEGWVAKAEALYDRILKFRENDRDQDIHNRVNTYEGLANIHQRRGNAEAAAVLYQKVVVIRKQELGSKYLSLQRARYNQARLYRDQGKTKEAITIFKAVLLEYEEVLGKEHPDTLRVACRLAFTYAQVDKLEKAEEIALGTLRHLESDVTQHYAADGLSRLVLATVATHRGQRNGDNAEFDRAKSLFKQVLKVYDVRLGLRHPTTLYVRIEESDVYQKSGDIPGAIRILEHIPKEHREGTAVDAKLARLYDHQAEFEKAQRLADQTHRLQRKRQGSKSADTNYCEWVLARIYVHQDLLELACEFYDKAEKGWSRIPNAIFGGSIDDLLGEHADVLDRLGRKDAAAEIRSKMGQAERQMHNNIDFEPPMFSEDDGCWADEDPNMTIKSMILDEKAPHILPPGSAFSTHVNNPLL